VVQVHLQAAVARLTMPQLPTAFKVGGRRVWVSQQLASGGTGCCGCHDWLVRFAQAA
jgi:hypothetical protein